MARDFWWNVIVFGILGVRKWIRFLFLLSTDFKYPGKFRLGTYLVILEFLALEILGHFFKLLFKRWNSALKFTALCLTLINDFFLFSYHLLDKASWSFYWVVHQCKPVFDVLYEGIIVEAEGQCHLSSVSYQLILIFFEVLYFVICCDLCFVGHAEFRHPNRQISDLGQVFLCVCESDTLKWLVVLLFETLNLLFQTFFGYLDFINHFLYVTKHMEGILLHLVFHFL